jgi:hypothetical protein
MQWGRFEDLKARLKALGLSGKLNTAFVERLQKPCRLLPESHPAARDSAIDSSHVGNSTDTGRIEATFRMVERILPLHQTAYVVAGGAFTADCEKGQTDS